MNTNLKSFINYQKSEATKRSYYIDITDMLMNVDKPENEITTGDLMDWTVTLRRYSTATQHRKIACIKSYFKFLYKRGIVQSNVAFDLEQVRIQHEEKIALSPEQLTTMLKGCKNARDKAIIVFMTNTGVRVSELINITLEQYLAGDEIVITGKGNKKRSIYINSMVQEYVSDYLKNRKGGCDKLFVSNQSTPMDNIALNRTLKTIAKRAGFETDFAKKISNHTMRRTTATLLNKRGETLTTIQHTLGHSDPSTTALYIKNTKEDVRRAVATPLF